ACRALLIGWLGAQWSQRLLVGFSAVAGVLMLGPMRWGARRNAVPAGKPSQFRMVNFASLVAAMSLAAGLAWSVPEVPWGLIAYGRYLPTKTENAKLLYLGEGMNA